MIDNPENYEYKLKKLNEILEDLNKKDSKYFPRKDVEEDPDWFKYIDNIKEGISQVIDHYVKILMFKDEGIKSGMINYALNSVFEIAILPNMTKLNALELQSIDINKLGEDFKVIWPDLKIKQTAKKSNDEIPPPATQSKTTEKPVEGEALLAHLNTIKVQELYKGAVGSKTEKQKMRMQFELFQNPVRTRQINDLQNSIDQAIKMLKSPDVSNPTAMAEIILQRGVESIQKALKKDGSWEKGTSRMVNVLKDLQKDFKKMGIEIPLEEPSSIKIEPLKRKK